jgi:hypothetical protein
MKRFNQLALLGFVLFSLACASEKQPATPVETFQTYVKAFKKKDITTMKLLLSNDTIKMHEQEAKSEGVTLDDVVKRETLLDPGQTTVEYRNEKINGDKATLEFKNGGFWETIPFIKEEGEWKIDKKGFADQMMQDVEQSGQQFDQTVEGNRQP